MQVIYVENDPESQKIFKEAVSQLRDVDGVCVFGDEDSAIQWVMKHPVDVAFLDIETSGILGLELAPKLTQISEDIRIVFITSHGEYALEAFGVDAIGYVLKPYSVETIQKELAKAKRFRPIPHKMVRIQTIPNFAIYVDGDVLHLGKTKSEELLALLVDRGERGLTSGEAIACLWPERPADNKTQSLYRMTLKRLMNALKEAGIEHIIGSKGREKYILPDKVECDLYQILAGEGDDITRYTGEYMQAYSWGEGRNAQLNRMVKAYF